MRMTRRVERRAIDGMCRGVILVSNEHCVHDMHSTCSGIAWRLAE